MSNTSVASLFDVSPRYLRSTNLERDFSDSKALHNYVLTRHAQECLTRLAGGLHSGSTQRAWRLTGNYGSGKSSFALFLAHWFAGGAAQLSKALQVDVGYERYGLKPRPKYLPLLITGSREPMGTAILRALARVLSDQYQRGATSLLQQRIEVAAAKGERLADEDIIGFISAANEKLLKDGKAGGLLVLVDELGKFLEHAAYHPETQDIYLLQRLAEAAARSGKTAPLFVVGLLHQGFDAYASSLDPSAQREWEKIAGRFDEILFNQPIVQVSELIASALRVRTSAVPAFAKEEARAGLDRAVALGWYGRSVSKAQATDLAPRTYPIHGTVLPVLVRAFARFGQNERSLFSFLLSDEPFGLRDFANREIARGSVYRLTDFYDYVRANFGYRLAMQSYRSHWAQIESMVESFATEDPLELQIIKTIGVLNLLDNPELLPTEEAVQAALGGPGGHDEAAIQEAVKTLHQRRRVLFRRGMSGTFCLWPHTSVDLESAYERAVKAVGQVESVGRHLSEFLQSRPLVARRHYIQTGNLRYFDVQYVTTDEIEKSASTATDADGTVIVALGENKADCQRAESLARGTAFASRHNTLLAVPNEPLSHQAGLVAEALRWEWVAVNTPELNADRFAREEVSRQKAVSRQRLEKRVQDLLGLRSLAGAMALKWYCAGRPVKISNGRELLESLSNLCDQLYPSAPRIKSELLNRRVLSSAAAAARTRLIDRVLSASDKPFLGMDPEKKPPEMSMYLSVLRESRIHAERPDGWRLRIPDGRGDPLNVAPCLKAIRAYLEQHGDRRVRASDLLNHLAKSPYGVREGLAPIFLAVYCAVHSQEMAFYEDGTFLREVKGDEFLRLSKSPESFELQLCRVRGIRAEVFAALLRVLNLKPGREEKQQHVLDVVRPLCLFVARLPDYARNTHRLSNETRAIREVILAAHEPVKLLFHDLPIACGFKAFPVGGSVPVGPAKEFSLQLKTRLDDLREAFDGLLGRMQKGVREAFDLNGSFDDVRAKLATRAESIVLLATEPKLRSFCLRLADKSLGTGAWLESLGSLLASQPPARWGDVEEDTFGRELSLLASRFKHLETIAFGKERPEEFSEAFRFSLTRSDGSEAQEVVFVDKHDVPDVESAAQRIRDIIGRDRRVGIAALSRVAWLVLKKDQE